MSGDVTITADQAAHIARHIRQMVEEDYQRGCLTEFMRGVFKGQFIVVQCRMNAEDWILEGIQNEINFYCRRAQQAESRPR